MFSFFGEISPNFDLKNMVLTYKGQQKEFFHGKNGPNSPDFKEEKKKNSKLPDLF